jgi:hypothetical protein
MVWSSVVAVGMMAVAWAIVSYLTMDRDGEDGTGEVAGYHDGRGEKHRGPGKGNVSRMVTPIRKPSGAGAPEPPADPASAWDAGATEGASKDTLVEGEDAEACEACADPWPLTAEGIQGAVEAGIDDIKHCYEQWLKLEPEIAGSIMVTFTVTPVDDAVGEVSALELTDSELEHPFIEGCVLNVFADIPFDAPADGGQVEVNYPLMFDTEGDPDAEDVEE